MKGVQFVRSGGGSNCVKQISLSAGVKSERVWVLRKRSEYMEALGWRIAFNDDSPRERNLDFVGHRREPVLAKPTPVFTLTTLTGSQYLQSNLNYWAISKRKRLWPEVVGPTPQVYLARWSSRNF
jgi:hypothetical protein